MLNGSCLSWLPADNGAVSQWDIWFGKLLLAFTSAVIWLPVSWDL
jgi:hypothetical protein